MSDQDDDAKAIANRAFFLYLEATGLANDGKWAEALPLLEESCRLSPFDQSQVLLASAYCHHQRWDDAEDLYLQVLDENQDNIPALWSYGMVLMITEQYDCAIVVFSRYTRLKPDEGDAFNQLALAYGSENQVENALENAKIAVEKDPKNKNYIHTLGLAYASAGQAESANEQVTRLTSLDPAMASELQVTTQRILHRTQKSGQGSAGASRSGTPLEQAVDIYLSEATGGTSQSVSTQYDLPERKGLCLKCGKPLGFLDKLLGGNQHKGCR